MDTSLRDDELGRPARRRFLKTLSTSMISVPALYWAARRTSAWAAMPQNPTPKQMLDEGPADAPWKIVMVSADEPGQPMIVQGTIFGADGKTALGGARLYVYHTDAHGYYNASHKFSEAPRLRGWMKTNELGHYQFRTIKPAPYPGRKIPAHIHPTVDAPGYPARWIDEYWFEGDPYLKPEDIQKNSGLGLFSQIVKLQPHPDGVLVGVRHIRLT